MTCTLDTGRTQFDLHPLIWSVMSCRPFCRFHNVDTAGQSNSTESTTLDQSVLVRSQIFQTTTQEHQP